MIYSGFEHPHKVGMSYIEHFYLTLSFSLIFVFTSFKVFLHALIPSIFKDSAYETIIFIKDNLDKERKNENRRIAIKYKKKKFNNLKLKD